MNRHDIEKNLRKIDADYRLGHGVSDDLIDKAQERLGETLPDHVINFYKSCNGLSVNSKLEIYDIGKLKKSGHIIEFANFNEKHRVGFDISYINDAGQWSIVNVESKYLITLTMASFLTNKIWAWLLRGREIWAEEKYT